MHPLFRAPIITALLYFAPAQAFQNEPDGFRGIKWSTPFDVHAQTMHLIEPGDDDKFYTRDNDKLDIGGAQLTRITYHYWRGQLAGVLLTSENIINQDALLRALQASFGPGTQPNRYLPQYHWWGAVTSITLKCNSISHQCLAFIRSADIASQITAAKNQAAQKAAGDF